MRRHLLPSCALAAALALFHPSPGMGEEVTLKADTLSMDPVNESYLATGKVRMVRDGYSLLADSVSYNRLTEEAVAQGAVRLEKGDDFVTGDWLQINLNTDHGTLLNGYLFVKKPNFHVRGRKVEKTGDENYRIWRGSFTTCDGPNPSWRFEARDVRITLDEYATGRDAVFYAGDVPILYFPYLIFPVKRERQSGLLLPKIGRSTRKGLYYTQPWYWAIDPSQEATFALDIQAARGVGTLVDYRYLRPRGSEGALQAFGIYDTSVGRYRGELNQKHLEFLSPDTVLSSDLHAITDRSYYKDYGETVGEYNRQYWESTVSADHKWERYNVTGLLSYVEDLRSPTNDLSLQRLPALRFTGAGEKVGPFMFSVNATATNFERVEGVTGQRVIFHPRLSHYSHPLPGLDLSLFAGYQERLYNTYGSDGPSGGQGVGLADAGVVAAVPLERIYGGSYRHVVTPALGYSYEENKNQSRLPFFDYDDQVLPRSVLTWSVANTVTRKRYLESGIPTYEELVYLRLSQAYDFSGTKPELLTPRDLLTLADPGHHLTDLMLEGRVSPYHNVTFGMDGRWNPIDGYLSTGNVSAAVTGEGGDKAAFAYRFSRGHVEYVEGTFTYAIVKWLAASALERYSLDRGDLLESRYSLEYRKQCWSVIFSYADRPTTTDVPGNREFMVNFTLTGVGSAGSIKLF